jgi:hypothetical protein
MADTIDWAPDSPDMAREQPCGLPLRDNPRSSPLGGKAGDFFALIATGSRLGVGDPVGRMFFASSGEIAGSGVP